MRGLSIVESSVKLLHRIGQIVNLILLFFFEIARKTTNGKKAILLWKLYAVGIQEECQKGWD